MTAAAKGYVVRDADITGDTVDQIYPYTLRGLTEALEEARYRSYGRAPQTLAVLADGTSKVIRRFEHGREVPVGPLPEPRSDRDGSRPSAVPGQPRAGPRQKILEVR